METRANVYSVVPTGTRHHAKRSETAHSGEAAQLAPVLSSSPDRFAS